MRVEADALSKRGRSTAPRADSAPHDNDASGAAVLSCAFYQYHDDVHTQRNAAFCRGVRERPEPQRDGTAQGQGGPRSRRSPRVASGRIVHRASKPPRFRTCCVNERPPGARGECEQGSGGCNSRVTDEQPRFRKRNGSKGGGGGVHCAVSSR